jgi:hypothetical protein
MTALFTILLLLAQPVPANLDQIRADTNLEHRARAAVDFAVAAERKAMETAVEVARDAFVQTGKPPQRHAGPYKTAELRTQEMLVRLGDLQRRMDADERQIVEGPRAKVQEIHDAWFEGIMGKKK